MISKHKIKFIKSLESKKERWNSGLFVTEGEKMAQELLNSHLKINQIFATESYLTNNDLSKWSSIIEAASQEEINRISFLKTPQSIVCLAHIPQHQLSIHSLKGKLSILLDKVQDPGNLGTIIRIADWFGIENIICTPDTSDAFNPKVVQATMGAICRVNIFYADFNVILKDIDALQMPVYGTTLDGENIYQTDISSNGFIMMGNESEGIDDKWETYLTQKLYIPHYPTEMKRSESLNVAIATSIVCSEFRRRLIF